MARLRWAQHVALATRSEMQPAGQRDNLLAPLGRHAVSRSRTTAFCAPRQPYQLAEINRRTREEDIQALRAAAIALEHPRLAGRLAEIAGKPIALFNRTLPEVASKAIVVATTQALNTALRVALLVPPTAEFVVQGRGEHVDAAVFNGDCVGAECASRNGKALVL
jgi:hypothetical protein